jgi:predicted O-linked N-acetylglucosamine transferase (SPINDLY family)
LRRADEALQKLLDRKLFAEALAKARQMAQRFPEHGPGWKKLGALLCWNNRFAEALIPLGNSVRLLPNDAEAHSNHGVALLHEKRVGEALAEFERAIELNPRFAAAHYHLGMTHLQEQRYPEGEACLLTAVALRPGYLTDAVRPVHSELLHLYSHNASFEARALFEEHRKFTGYVEVPVRRSWPRHANTRDPERRLRIGFVSGDLVDHSVAMFLEPVVVRLKADPRLTLYAYHNRDMEDAVTARLRSCFHEWHSITSLKDVELAAKITADRIDILVDLSGHTALNRLRMFARKPAPLQVSWLGYPGTTGLEAMDYYVADAEWLTPGRFDALFTERLVYLPDRWAFVPHPKAPAITPLPALATGQLTFGSFHRFCKLNASTIERWALVMSALPGSRLLMAGISPEQQGVLIERFAARGVSAGRLTFHRRCSMELYLGLHSQVDLALDTHPYSGATTTMHSLSMGVPTLTVEGNTSWAAACSGILRHVELDGFIAADAGDFVARAVHWAGHLNELADLRSQLRLRLAHSPGAQPDLIAAHVTGALRHMWRRWCAGQTPESFHSVSAEPAS